MLGARSEPPLPRGARWCPGCGARWCPSIAARASRLPAGARYLSVFHPFGGPKGGEEEAYVGSSYMWALNPFEQKVDRSQLGWSGKSVSFLCAITSERCYAFVMAANNPPDMQSASGTSDATQLAGGILHPASVETLPTFQECREVLVRMVQKTQDLKLRSYVENIRRMEDLTARPPRDVLRVMASELKVLQKVAGKNVPVEHLHSNVQGAFNALVQGQRRSQPVEGSAAQAGRCG